jgi:hypothetical protein
MINVLISILIPHFVEKKLFPSLYMIPTFDIHAATENVFIFDRRVNTLEHYTVFGRPYWHL